MNLKIAIQIFKGQKILLWRPKISLEKGLRMTINYYKDKKVNY